jgi:cell division protein FtsW (lipid II flippase)
MHYLRGTTSGLYACAPLPALIIGIATMRHLGVNTAAWSTNIAATVLGLLIWAIGSRLPPPSRPATQSFIVAAALSAILLTFVSEGMLGVHRWISISSFRLHASAIAAPLILFCVAAAAFHSRRSALVLALTTGIMLALQPDAAQTLSFVAGSAVILAGARVQQRRNVLVSVALLAAVSVAAFIRHDPLPPVTHVEGIFAAAAARSPAGTVAAAIALLLLPVPFAAAWYRHRHITSLALGVYVVMTLLAPAWGTFPVPVMGYGVSPILGYFIALVVGVGRPSRVEEASSASLSSLSA